MFRWKWSTFGVLVFVFCQNSNQIGTARALGDRLWFNGLVKIKLCRLAAINNGNCGYFVYFDHFYSWLHSPIFINRGKININMKESGWNFRLAVFPFKNPVEHAFNKIKTLLFSKCLVFNSNHLQVFVNRLLSL